MSGKPLKNHSTEIYKSYTKEERMKIHSDAMKWKEDNEMRLGRSEANDRIFCMSSEYQIYCEITRLKPKLWDKTMERLRIERNCKSGDPNSNNHISFMTYKHIRKVAVQNLRKHMIKSCNVRSKVNVYKKEAEEKGIIN